MQIEAGKTGHLQSLKEKASRSKKPGEKHYYLCLRSPGAGGFRWPALAL